MRASGLRSLLLLCIGAALLAPSASADADPDDDWDPDVVELAPQDAPSWSLENVLAPVTGLFLGGPGYWYSAREIEIDTTPPGAILDLFYVRRNFQKAYQQADAPAKVVLPPRIEATSRDSLTIRALLDGYQRKEVRLKVRSRTEKVMIDLSPLPNSLVAFAHTYFAGRGSLTFLTKEALTFRLQKSPRGFGVVLTETGGSEEAEAAMRGASSALVNEVRPQQLGEDLVVRVDLTERGSGDDMETRSRQSVDPIRGLHRFSLDLVPKDGGAAAIESARAALARITPSDVTGCPLEFDRSLREQMEPAALARALSPSGTFTDKYLRAAMKRLGEVSPGGVIRMRDGSEFRGDVPIELMAAASQPGEAIGYLVLLRTFVAELEPADYRRSTLHGLIAPETPPSSFEAIVDAAEARERSCLTTTAGATGALPPG
jgi:hypothetical protein